MHAAEVTELHGYVGNGTVGRHRTGSLKQHSGPTQESGSISPLSPILHHFCIYYYPFHLILAYNYVIIMSLLRILTVLRRHYYYVIITYSNTNNCFIITYCYSSYVVLLPLSLHHHYQSIGYYYSCIVTYLSCNNVFIITYYY